MEPHRHTHFTRSIGILLIGRVYQNYFIFFR